jgi:hypothetical protein
VKAQKTASVSGNWSNTATWGGAAVPTSTEAVIINSGITVTVDVTNAVCASMKINTANTTAILTFAGSGSPVLTVSGAVTVGDIGNSNREGTITFTKGSTLIAGSLSLGAIAAQTSLIDMTAGGLLKVNGALTVFTGSTFTAGAGTVELTATNTLPSSIFTSFNNLTISGGTTTLGAAVSVDTLNIGTGATLTPGANLITLTGDFVNSGTMTSGSGGMTISGTAATQSIDGFTTTGPISMTKTAGTATFTGNINGAGLTINGTGGTLNLGTSLSHTFSGTLTRTAGTLNGGSSTLTLSSLTPTSGTAGTFTPGTGTVVYSAAGNQTIGAFTYNNLTLSGSGTKTTPSGTSVTRLLSISGTAKDSIPAGLNLSIDSLSLGGNGTVNSTWGSTSATTATYKFDSVQQYGINSNSNSNCWFIYLQWFGARS